MNHLMGRPHAASAAGIEYVAGEQAPLVFYSGFTRSFLAGEQGTSAQWLQKRLRPAIQTLLLGKRFACSLQGCLHCELLACHARQEHRTRPICATQD